MPNFLLSRIAVNLLLIVAIAIQPVAFCWANVDCQRAVTLTGGHIGQGCGCCGGKESSDCCCCHAEPADDPAESTVHGSNAKGCCGADHTGQELARQIDCKHETAIVETTSTAILPLDRDPLFRPICRCGIESQPLSDATPTRGTNDLRNSLSLLAFDRVGSPWEGRLPRPQRLERNRAVVPAHFSQLHLCVWRL